MTRERSKKMGEIIARAWADDAFKQRLLNDATTVLREEGVEVPAGLEVRAVANTHETVHIVLPPPPPSSMEVSDNDLERVSGGATLTPGCSLLDAKPNYCRESGWQAEKQVFDDFECLFCPSL